MSIDKMQKVWDSIRDERRICSHKEFLEKALEAQEKVLKVKLVKKDTND